MNTVVKLTDEQIKELNEIKSLINSNDEESIILGCNLILENYPSGMIDSEWYKYGSFFCKKSIGKRMYL